MGDTSNGQVLGRAFETLGRNPFGFGLLALLLVALPTFLSLMLDLVPGGGGFLVGAEDTGASTFIVLFLTFLFKAIAICASIRAGETAKPDLGAASLVTLKRLPFLIGVTLLSWIGIIIGFILLIVPGVIVFCMLSVAVPALLAENGGVIESLSRSRALTDGNKGMIFTLYFLFGILQSVASGIFSLIASATGGDLVVRAVLAAVLATGVAMVDAAIASALYVELRTAKEGGMSDELVAVFE